MLIVTLDDMEKLHMGKEITLQFERRGHPFSQAATRSGRSQQVNVRIDAPSEVTIIRQELDERGNR